MVEGKEHSADTVEALPELIAAVIRQKAKNRSFGTYSLELEFKDGVLTDLRTSEVTTHKFKPPKHD